MKQAAKALIRNDQGKILVLYRSETHPHLAHDIDLPGGEIELDEITEIGLEREIIEETGLTISLLPDQQTHSWQSFFGATHMLYEVTFSGETKVEISWEHESYDWISEDDFIAHAAIDEFMHKVQEWLRKKDSLADPMSQPATV